VGRSDSRDVALANQALAQLQACREAARAARAARLSALRAENARRTAAALGAGPVPREVPKGSLWAS
jgi:hypothetical protein